MARRKGVLSGSALSDQSKIARDLPSVGTKDFLPTHSWLERKQIEKCLEKQLDLIGEQRIELLSCISTAEWCPEERKAKLTKKVGKHFEVLGHHLNNEDWLFPEEALYLLEIKSLELYYGGVRLSIERSYSLLLESYNDKCSLQEYMTYSYLCRLGYKVLRHSPDIRLTKYEKDIRMDNVMKQKKRDVTILDEVSSVIEPASVDEESRKSVSPCDDVIVLSPVEQIITIDDDDEEEVVMVQTKAPVKDEDVVFLSSSKRTPNSRHWYLPKKYFLVSSKEVVNLCDDEDDNCDTKEEEGVKDLKKIFDLVDTPRRIIVNALPNAKSGVYSIRCPDRRLLPPAAMPNHCVYEVNLNIRDSLPTPAPPTPQSQALLPVSAQHQQYPGALLRQVQDMQTLFYGMVQATSSLMNMFAPNTQMPLNNFVNPQLQSHLVNQMGLLRRSWSLPTAHTPPTHHFPYNSMYRPPQGQYLNNNYRFNYRPHPTQSRGFHWPYNRGYRGNYRRGFRQRGRSNFTRPRCLTNIQSNQHVILLDSDDDDDVSIVEVKKRPMSPSVKVTPKKVKFDVKDLDLKVDFSSDGDSSSVASIKVNDEDDKGDVKIEKSECSDSLELDDVEEKGKTKKDEIVEEAQEGETSWAQVKLNPDPPMDNSDEFDIEPLVNPIDHTSFESVLEALQIFKPHTQPLSREIKISFDVYTSNCAFKKSHKMLPHLRVIVLNHSEDLPTAYEMNILKNIYPDQVPFLFSIVSEEDISFYNYDAVSLPTLS